MAQPFYAATPQAPEAHYRVFDSKGTPSNLQNIADALDGADVLIIGETHDDPVAHLLEAELLRRADERYARAQSKKRAVALSMEMFERDVQTALDEYLAGLITERNFLLSSRPWPNYSTDYRPLVEYARGHRLPVIAANAPARYVSRVSANGPDSLNVLSKQAKAWLPPLPFPPSSPDYAAKFNDFMQAAMGGPHSATPSAPNAQVQANPHGSMHLLDAQDLRDASMADAIAEFLKHNKDALVVQVNGTFHSEERMGVPEQINHYRPKARVVVITIVPDEGFPNFDAARLGKLGDYVIVTDPSLPRSQ
ncbi:MAG TPA: ChaN family lipoprotein [Pyrinomonadaceae bacterium]|nr:ChaN family lipoprotein [Pyrinomonadaceae bacterium]